VGRVTHALDGLEPLRGVGNPGDEVLGTLVGIMAFPVCSVIISLERGLLDLSRVPPGVLKSRLEESWIYCTYRQKPNA
jgi:hypothetical protein